MSGGADGESGRRAETWGRASGSGQVYQSGGDQQITHVHVRAASSTGGVGEDGTEAGLEILRMNDQLTTLVQVLTLTAAEWQARCGELAEEVLRARTEGRAEALAEVEDQLRESELRVIKAQRMMREAQEERRKSETLLMQAQQEAVQRRRAEEQSRAASQAEALPILMEDRRAEQLSAEGAEFTQIMDEAEAQLASLRDELRVLGEDAKGKLQEPALGIVVGETVGRPPEAQRSAASPGTPEPEPGSRPDTAGTTSPPGGAAQPPSRVPGPPRRGRMAFFLVVCAIPEFLPMLTVTTLRAVYAADPDAWQAVVVTAAVVLAGAVAYLLVGFVAVGATADSLDRSSENSVVMLAFGWVVVGGIVLLTAAFFTPLDWPGPAGAWGRWIASLMGLDA